MNETTSFRDHFQKLLKTFDTVMLVTQSDGHLRARPMAIAQIEDDWRLWFISGANSAKDREIRADTRVLLVCQKDHSIYLALNGRASVSRDRSKIAEVWQEAFRVWFPDGKEDSNIELICISPEEGEYWDNAGMNKVKYAFESVAAYVTGKTPSMQEGEQHGRGQL